MHKLIKIELIKIFHKKSIYVMLLIMTTFCILNNILYLKNYDKEGYYKNNIDNIQEKIKELSRELEKNREDKNTYTILKTKIEILKLKKTFPTNSWQYQTIEQILYDTIYQKNLYTYEVENKEKQLEYTKILTNEIEKLNQNNWQYFIKKDITKTENNIKNLQILKKEVENEQQKYNQITKELNIEQITLETLKYRLEHQIKKEKTYLNDALEKKENARKIIALSQNKILSEEEKKENLEQKAIIAISDYILNKEKNINKENSTNYQLRTLTEDYELFLVIILLMVSSTIICEEFGKGTIKLLLIKPYSRVKILISKLLTCLIILLLTITFLIGIQFILGSICFGIESLKYKVIVYNFYKEEIIEYSIWYYMLIRIIARLPYFIILLLISMMLSVYFTNTVISLIIPLLLSLLDKTIMQMEKLSITKYLIHNYWHFENYLFQEKIYENIKPISTSAIIYLTYLVILLTITIYTFKKKNIKNI